MTVCSIDFETRSAADLKKTGAHRYFEDPTADVLCAAYAFDDGPVHTWRIGLPCPDDLRAHISQGGKLAAWNAAFEFWAFTVVLGPRHGWPVPRINQMIDTMAQAAAMSIPQSLDGAAKAMGLEQQKDKDGMRLIRKFSMPRKARKGETPGRLYWTNPEDDPADFQKFVSYCAQDVEVERALRKLLVPLSDAEQQVWEFTLTMNDRGAHIDRRLVEALLDVTEQAKEVLDRRMARATGFEITACSQVAALTNWLKMQGVPADKLNKNAIEDLLATDLPDAAREAVEIRKEAAKTSTAKLVAMQNTMGKDNRVRGLHLYHGAGTGRWSGRLVQCVTGDHEVLTRHGWKRIDSVVGPVEIMQWSPTTRRMSWAHGVVNAFPAPEKLAVVNGTAIRGRYTLDHRMPMLKGGFKDWTPKKLLDVKRRDGFLVVDPVDQPDCALSDDQIRLLVATQADGTVKAGRGAMCWRFSKHRKIDRLRDTLIRLGLRFRQIVRTNAEKPVVEFTVAADDVPAWLTKGYGPWVLGLSARQAQLALDELAEWDGFRHQRNGAVCLMSPEKEQVEWMATLAALAGRQTTLAWYADHKSERGRWSLYTRSSETTTLRASEVSVIANDEPVYCPTVPGGYWLCRYDNRIYVTGNTQNMPRGTGTVKEPEEAVDDFLLGNASWIDLTYGLPMSAVSDMLRSCITASPGNRLLAADYSSIEGRVTAWVAGEEDELAAYRAVDAGTGAGIYEIAASGIFNVDPFNVTKAQRQCGKCATLGLGFGGGVLAFHSMAQIYNIDMAPVFPILRETTDAEVFNRALERYEECAERGDTGTDVLTREAWIASEVTKVLWRQRHPSTVALWAGLQQAAHDAVAKPGEIVTYGCISYLVRRGFLWCRLPSGRCLAYGAPKIEDRETPWGAVGKSVTALGVNSVTKKWERFALYGGLATENVVQAIARDLMANGMLQAEAAGYPIVMTIHDEAVADVPIGHGTLAEFERLLCDLPGWATGLPVVASGWEKFRYCKD